MSLDRSADVVDAEAEAPVLFELVPAPQAAPVSVPPRRPFALIPLYSSFASLQVLDVHSTWRALDNGALEGNPLVASIAGSHGFPLVKIVTTTAMIVSIERLRKNHPRAAVFAMVAANSAYAMIVANNYALVRSQ